MKKEEKGKRKIDKKTITKIYVLVGIVIFILALDLVTKYVLDAVLASGETVTIIPYLFNFKLTYNIGAAWGILGGKQAFLIALSILFLVIFIVYYCKEKRKTWLLTVTFAFLIGGCLGNLYDRIVLGYVRDFIQFAFWDSFPVFNFADVFLTIGVVLFAIYIIIFFVKEYKKSQISTEMPEDKLDVFAEDDINADNEFDENAVVINEKIEALDEKLKKIDEKTAKNSKKMQKNEKKSKINSENSAGEETLSEEGDFASAENDLKEENSGSTSEEGGEQEGKNE